MRSNGKYCVLHFKRRWEKNQINVYESIKHLMDMMSKSKNENKKLNWKKITSGVFNLKRAQVTVTHISCVKNFWRRHNPTILISSRKEEVINILNGN